MKESRTGAELLVLGKHLMLHEQYAVLPAAAGEHDEVTHVGVLVALLRGEVSPDGVDHFPVVVRKEFELSAKEPAYTAEQIGVVKHRTLVMVADDDIVTLEHALEFYRGLPNSELAVVPGTSHFLMQEKPALCNTIILDFLTNDPVQMVAPIRRAQSPS